MNHSPSSGRNVGDPLVSPLTRNRYWVVQFLAGKDTHRVLASTHETWLKWPSCPVLPPTKRLCGVINRETHYVSPRIYKGRETHNLLKRKIRRFDLLTPMTCGSCPVLAHGYLVSDYHIYAKLVFSLSFFQWHSTNGKACRADMDKCPHAKIQPFRFRTNGTL